MGLQGRDLLMGGRNNDTYYFQLGHGHDTIDEQNLGGFEKVIIRGFENFNSFRNDLAFRRLGNDLEIRIDLDNLDDPTADTITIKNMTSVGSRVERLELQRDGLASSFGAISLPSIFSQSDDTLKRFEVIAGSDAFGRLASPVG